MEEALIRALLAQPYMGLTQKEFSVLRLLAAKYPYFATLHAILAKQAAVRGLDQEAKPLLVKAAAYAPDRLILRQIIESKAPGAKSHQSYAKPPQPITIVTDAAAAPDAPEVWVVEPDKLNGIAPVTAQPETAEPSKPSWMIEPDEKPIWLPDDEADFSHQDANIGAWPGLDTQQHLDHTTAGENEPAPFRGHAYPEIDPKQMVTEEQLAEKGGAFMVEANSLTLPDPDDELILTQDVDSPTELGQQQLVDHGQAALVTDLDLDQAQNLAEEIQTELDLDTNPDLDLEPGQTELPTLTEADILAGQVPTETQKWEYETTEATQASTDSFFNDLDQAEMPAQGNTDALIKEILGELDKYRQLKHDSKFDFGPEQLSSLSAQDQYVQELANLHHNAITDMPEVVALFAPEGEENAYNFIMAAQPDQEELIDLVQEVPTSGWRNATELETATDLSSNPEEVDYADELEPEQQFDNQGPSMASDTDTEQVANEFEPDYLVNASGPDQQSLSLYEQLMAEAQAEDQAIEEMLQNIINDDLEGALLSDEEAATIDTVSQAESPTETVAASPPSGLATTSVDLASTSEELSADEIINQFLEANPKISPIPSTSTDQTVYDLSAQASTLSDDDLTENLAQIMVKQGKMDKAIEIYCKLILKNPEKTPYFASRINALAGAMGEK